MAPQETYPVDVERAVELLEVMIAGAEREGSDLTIEAYKKMVWRLATQARGLLTRADFFPADREHAEEKEV